MHCPAAVIAAEDVVRPRRIAGDEGRGDGLSRIGGQALADLQRPALLAPLRLAGNQAIEIGLTGHSARDLRAMRGADQQRAEEQRQSAPRDSTGFMPSYHFVPRKQVSSEMDSCCRGMTPGTRAKQVPGAQLPAVT